jgi:MFS family permease
MSMSRLTQGMAAFARTWASPNLRRAELSFGAIWAGEWAVTVAVGVLAFNHGGAEAVGIVGMVRLLPPAFLAPVAAPALDRFPRDQVLFVVCLLRTFLLGGVALLVALNTDVILTYGLLTLAMLVHTVYRPAHTTLLPTLCTTASELTSANIARGFLDSTSALVGPLVAGGLIAEVGLAGVFSVCAAAALWAAWLTSRLDYEAPPHVVQAAPFRPVREVIEGLDIVRRNADLVVVTLDGAAQTFTRGCFSVFAVVVALRLLGLHDSGVGILTAGFGAGAIFGSLAASLLVDSARLGRWFAVSLIGWGLPFVALAATSSLVLALVLLGVVGIANALLDVSGYTLFQWLIPEEVMGRAFTTIESFWTLTMAAGSIATSGLIIALGTRGALIAAGLVAPAAAVLSLRRLRHIDSRVEVAGTTVALLQRVPFLDPLPLATISRLAAEAARLQCPAGTVIIEEGTAGDDFFVIADGRAEVSVDGRPVRELGPAECFGEIALLRGGRRTSTVRAETALQLLRFEGRQFVRIVNGYTPSTAAATTLIEDRLAHAASSGAREAVSGPS